MRVVIQRVSKASVKVEHETIGEIGNGLMILLGIEDQDNREDADWLTKKICNLRIFDDDNGVMNLSLRDIKGQILAISQFTLHAKTKKGNRPSYIAAAKPEISIPLYEYFVNLLEQESETNVATGKFGAHMEVELINDGPVTIIIDSKNKE